MARKKEYNLSGEMIQLIDEFNEYLELFEKSEATKKTYINYIKKFTDDNKINKLNQFVNDLDKKWWMKYIKDEKEKGELSMKTLNKHLKICTSFYKFLKEQDYFEGDIPCKVSNIKAQIEYKGDNVITEEELKRLIEATDNVRFKSKDRNIKRDLRDKLIIYLFCNIGLRIDEMSKIRLEDIDLDTRTLYVRGKAYGGRVSREANFNERVKELIVECVEFDPNRIYLFENYKGDKLDTQSIRKIWYRACDVAEIGRPNPHKIRHTLGSLLIEKGVSVKKVSMILGHSTSKVTEKFYIHKKEDLGETLEVLDIF